MKLLQHGARGVMPFAVVLVLAALAVSCGGKSSTQTTAAASGPSSLPSNSWAVPVDVANATASPGPSQDDWSNFAWQTFVALNWPASTPSPVPSGTPSGVSGLPNQQLPIGASASNGALVPTVWLTYRTDGNTFLPAAQDPGAWGSPPNPRPCGVPSASPYVVAPGFNPMVLDLASKLGNVEQAFSDAPLVEQTGWYVTYDIRLDMSEYTYIHQNGYYNAATQEAAFPSNAPASFVPFPKNGTESMNLPAAAQFGALEIKAAWRVLDPVADKAVIPRYYTQTGYFIQPDGSCTPPTLFGLIGLHVLRLTPTTGSTWFWATFEQVDNVDSPPGSPEPPTLASPGTPNGNCTSPPYNVAPSPLPANSPVPWSSGNPVVNVCRVTGISANVQAINQAWQSRLAGTVWANYEMIDTINPATPGETPYPIPIASAGVNTNILANTSMETYFQGKPFGKSCMDCHAQYGFPQGAPSTPTYQVFTFLLTDAQTPPAAGARLSAEALKNIPKNRRHHFPPALVKAIHDTLLHHQ